MNFYRSTPELDAIGAEITFNDACPPRGTVVDWCVFLGGSAGAIIRPAIDFISFACLITWYVLSISWFVSSKRPPVHRVIRKGAFQLTISFNQNVSTFLFSLNYKTE